MTTESDDDAERERVALEDVDDEAFETLVADAAALVRDGVLAVEDLSVQSLLQEGEAPTAELSAAFESAVVERADARPEGDPEPDEPSPTGRSSVRPENVDWVHLWWESNLDPDDALSRTQLRLAVDVSSQTPVSDTAADDFIDAAVERGLVEFEDGRYRVVRSTD